MRAQRSLVALATAFAAVSAASRAVAEERPVLFTLAIAETPLERCGGGRALEQAVEERLHRTTFSTGEVADVVLAVAPEPSADPATWRAQIVERDRDGTELGRRDVPLPDDDCKKALDTLAVVLAIMIGPSRTTTDPPRGLEPGPMAPIVVPPRARGGGRPRSKPATPPEPLRWTASPMAGMAVGTGVLPGTSWGVEAGAVVRPPVARLSMIARASYWPGTDTPTVPPARIDRLGGGILGCGDVLREGALGLAGCGGVELMHIQARSDELTRVSEGSFTVAALGELRIGYRLYVQNRVFMEPYIAPQLMVLLTRDQFTYRDVSGRERTLLLPAPAAFHSSVGVAVHFL